MTRWDRGSAVDGPRLAALLTALRLDRDATAEDSPERAEVALHLAALAPFRDPDVPEPTPEELRQEWGP